ncbi:MAG: CDP-diacylglycerol--serine O-phosphatidyltransferase [Methanimicrococcus sp.]|nr:CDP-diacylglycerol--serine O-phosphatidyltransferase [Methanimicrococcus sp.]
MTYINLLTVLNLLKAPDYVSMVNLIFGILAILFAMNGDYEIAAACIIIAAAADGADGYIARKTSSGPLGAHLDSLIDIVSFGVAPAVIIYSMGEKLILIPLICFYVICGVLRLARYNAFPSNKPEYSGIPITGAAVFLSTLIISHFNATQTGYNIPYAAEILQAFMLILSILMVSSFSYPKVMRKEIFVLLIILFSGTVISVFVEMSFMILFSFVLTGLMCFYLISPAIGLIRKKKKIEL